MADITQADLDAAIAEAVAGLQAKNEELIGDLRKAKADLRVAKDIDPADMARLEDELAAARQDVAKLSKDGKAAIERAEKAEKAYADETAHSARVMIDNALNDGLAGAGVTNPAMLKAVKAMMASNAQVAIDGDARGVKIGDKPLADYVKEWSATDEAKHFISAPGNTGGGANGGRGTNATSGKTMTDAEFNALSARDRAAKMADGVQLIDG